MVGAETGETVIDVTDVTAAAITSVIGSIARFTSTASIIACASLAVGDVTGEA